MKFLFTGFTTFANHKENPSEDLMALLPKNDNIKTLVLPVSYGQCFDILNGAIDDFKPHVVVSFGLAQKRKEISLERIAINCIDSSLADNTQNIIKNQKIDPQGPDGIFSTFNILKLKDRSKVPIKISNTSGTYVCNFLMYKLLQKSKQENFLAGFIHLPSYEFFNKQEVMQSALGLIEKITKS